MIKKHFRYFFIAVLLTLWLSPLSHAQTPAGEIPKNIILFIGDGMGLAHVTAAYIDQGGLNLEKFPHTGFVFTSSIDKFLPSSCGATTTLATGVETKVDFVGLDASGRPVKTILEHAQEQGRGTGLISTSSLTDATPACFVAHLPSRAMDNRIAVALAQKDIDVLIGGGLAYFLPASDPRSARRDNQDLVAVLAETHQIVTTADEFQALKKPAKLAAFLALGDMPAVPLRRVSLSDMTRKAIEILAQNKNGFFLMIEASQIDWASHHGYGEDLIRETVDLDKAVGVALDFVKNRDDTLIIVASDHETGGYVILDGSVNNKKVTQSIFLTSGHSATMVPIFAKGPGGDVFSGIHRMEYIGRRLGEYILGK